MNVDKLQNLQTQLRYRQTLYERSEQEAKEQIYRLYACALITLNVAGYLFVCAA